LSRTTRENEETAGSAGPGDLRAKDLVKRYGRRAVVDGVDIELRRGEVVGLLGPNGAGKTTTFHMIVGLLTPDEGAVFLDDTDVTREPMYRRARMGIGYLSQESSIFRGLTVGQNVMSILETLGGSPSEENVSPSFSRSSGLRSWSTGRPTHCPEASGVAWRSHVRS
jgi:ABC-type lipopolysaccharide export system ATPase subunit